MATTKRKCVMCKKVVKGRSDKKFCSVSCKSTYHNKLKEANNHTTHHIDKILHRNRAILLELLGKRAGKKKILKILLDQKKFNYLYCTGMHTNKQGKTVWHIYDFSYLIFSEQDVLVTRNFKFLELFEEKNEHDAKETRQ